VNRFGGKGHNDTTGVAKNRKLRRVGGIEAHDEDSSMYEKRAAAKRGFTSSERNCTKSGALSKIDGSSQQIYGSQDNCRNCEIVVPRSRSK
jgi:hypothetical protein